MVFGSCSLPTQLDRDHRLYLVLEVPEGVPQHFKALHYGRHTRAYEGICSLHSSKAGLFKFKRVKTIEEAKDLYCHHNRTTSAVSLRCIRWQ